jgi:hypothetical protein
MKSQVYITVAFVLLSACTKVVTKPYQVSLLPGEFKPKPWDPPTYKPNPEAPRFDMLQLLGCSRCALDKAGQTVDAPAGMAIDEATFVQIHIYDAADLTRIREENSALYEYIKGERELVKKGELIYQKKISDLEKELVPSFWDRTKFEWGVAVGIVLTVGIIIGANAVQ